MGTYPSHKWGRTSHGPKRETGVRAAPTRAVLGAAHSSVEAWPTWANGEEIGNEAGTIDYPDTYNAFHGMGGEISVRYLQRVKHIDQAQCHDRESLFFHLYILRPRFLLCFLRLFNADASSGSPDITNGCLPQTNPTVVTSRRKDAPATVVKSNHGKKTLGTELYSPCYVPLYPANCRPVSIVFSLRQSFPLY